LTHIHNIDHAVARCLSVCPSITCQYYIETAKHSRILYILGDPLFRFFCAKCYGSICTGRVWKKSRFL